MKYEGIYCFRYNGYNANKHCIEIVGKWRGSNDCINYSILHIIIEILYKQDRRFLHFDSWHKPRYVDQFATICKHCNSSFTIKHFSQIELLYNDVFPNDYL